MILDTNFIVALEREARRGVAGPAMAFLAAHPDTHFHITFTIAGELACGQSASALQAWQRLCQPFPILPWTLEVSGQYGEIFRHLQSSGSLIGTNDMWIAATALVHRADLVTNNLDEFRRIPGLLVVPF